MRVLTVRQPWAWAIIHGGKDVENRVRNVAGAYRGPVAIHVAQEVDLGGFSGRVAALTRAANAYNETNNDILKSGPWHSDRGAIIGVVDLSDVHEGGVTGCHPDPKDATRLVWCSPWAEPGERHLVLSNPRPLARAIPFKGALGLRTLDDDTTARVLATLSPSTGTQTESETEHG